MGLLSCCITPPASVQPRKIYNVLVPVLFSDGTPSLDQPVSVNTQRKVVKLEEYVENNPDRIPKVRGEGSRPVAVWSRMRNREVHPGH